MSTSGIVIALAAVVAFYLLYRWKSGKHAINSKQVFPSNSIRIEKYKKYGTDAQVGDIGFSLLLKGKTPVYFYLDDYKAGNGYFAFVENEVIAEHLRDSDKCLIKVLAVETDSYIVSYTFR